jgi:hypothetical protein
MVDRFGFATHVPVGVGQTSADTPQIASCPRLALRQPSKSLFPALVEGDPSVRKPRRLPRQLDDRLPHLAAIGERYQKNAFIAFLHNLSATDSALAFTGRISGRARVAVGSSRRRGVADRRQ